MTNLTPILKLAPLGELHDFVVEIHAMERGEQKHIATRMVRAGGEREAINAAVVYAFGARAELDHDMSYTNSGWIRGTVGGPGLRTRDVWIKVIDSDPPKVTK